MNMNPEALIDRQAVAALFADFDEDTGKLLLSAAEGDIIECSEKLIEAWLSGNIDGQKRARHSLKGVCANFGVTALLAICAGDISDQETVAKLRICRASTLAALREAAGG